MKADDPRCTPYYLREGKFYKKEEVVAHWSILSDEVEDQTQILPNPRYKHLSVFYKNKLVIFGGKSFESTDTVSLMEMWLYSPDKASWRKILTKMDFKQFNDVEWLHSSLLASKWFILGKSNRQHQKNAKLCRFNFDTLQWIKSQQKGQVPTITEEGCLTNFDKNWLLYYGSNNVQQYNNIMYFYLFSFDNKIWYKCEGSYEFTLKARKGAKLCTHNNKIYLFGGEWEDSDSTIYLNDFYQIKITLPTKSTLPKIDAYKIGTSNQIQGRAHHFLMSIQKYNIVLFGGYNQLGHVKSWWIFNVDSQLWIKFQVQQCNVLDRVGLSCNSHHNQLFFFGGMISNQIQQFPVFKNDLWQLDLNLIALNERFPYSQQSMNCQICYEHNNNFVFDKKVSSSLIIQDVTKMMDFPYSAFGLLIDNCMILKPTIIDVSCWSNKGIYTIKIQDNGKQNWIAQDLIQSFSCFQFQQNLILTGSDKKVKKQILMQNQRKQFGNNMKIGCLRLGKRALYISKSDQQILVFLLYKQDAVEGQQQNYCLQYYSLYAGNNLLIDEELSASRAFIQYEHHEFIRQAIRHKKSTHFLYIFDTILNSEEQILRIRPDNSDIYLGDEQQINQLKKMGYEIADCIDISLKAYLTSLYLKPDELDITLTLNKVTTSINLEAALQKIDKVNKNGMTTECQGIVEFDFKLAEFYFLKELKKPNHFFSNGFLLYAKNRLINRYSPPLGEMISYLLNGQNLENNDYVQDLQFFGCAELPDSIPVNVLKTNFVFSMMLEKLYSRIKFVIQSLAKKYNPNQVNKQKQTHKNHASQKQKEKISSIFGPEAIYLQHMDNSEKKVREMKNVAEIIDMIHKKKEKDNPSSKKIKQIISQSESFRPDLEESKHDYK